MYPQDQPKQKFLTRKKLFIAVGLLAVLVIGGAAAAMLSPKPEPQEAKTDTQEVLPDETSSETTAVKPADTEVVTPTPAPAAQPSPTPAAPTPAPKTTPAPAPTPPPPPPPTPAHTISYTSSCFSPSSLTINNGETVHFVNNSSVSVWPASNSHPQHTIYPEFDALIGYDPGETFSFAFLRSGTWGYHDHLHPGCTGSITVN